MATPSTTQGESPESSARSAPPAKGGTLADLLTALDNGIRITGLVLAIDEPRVFKGTSKGGTAYSIASREIQIWTGNRAANCVDKRDNIDAFPSLALGERSSFRIKGVRMNGTVPVFEIDTESH